MRELKFRAWDKENKVYLNPDITFLIAGNGYYPATFSSTFGYTANENLVLEQYTGLKDKNGKEIYEGDIVSMNLEYEELEPGDCKLISFRDGCFRVGDGYEDEAGFYLQDWRVVGNIHENPKLLKGDE